MDVYPSHLLPDVRTMATAETVQAARLRYRMSFFVDTYFTKVNPLMYKLVGADHGEPQEKIVEEVLRLLEKDIEPLLFDTCNDGEGKYFAGGGRMTYVEVSTHNPTDGGSACLVHMLILTLLPGNDGAMDSPHGGLQQRHRLPLPSGDINARYNETTSFCQVGELVHAASECHLYLGQGVYGPSHC